MLIFFLQEISVSIYIRDTLYVKIYWYFLIDPDFKARFFIKFSFSIQWDSDLIQYCIFYFLK